MSGIEKIRGIKLGDGNQTELFVYFRSNPQPKWCEVSQINGLLNKPLMDDFAKIHNPAIASIEQSVSEAVNTNNATPTTRRMVEENAENEDTDCRPYRSEFVNKLVELSRKRPRAETDDEPIAEKQLDRRPYQSKYLFELIAAKRRRVESVIEHTAAPEE